MSSIEKQPTGPLKGLKVLELAHFIAGPFCTRLLADQGADVIKVEPPGKGDPFRTWGLQAEGTSPWWSSHGRNKKCVTLNLKEPEGQALAMRLIREVDVVVENYRPGQLEKWGLGFEDIQRENPRCILARISGFGQDGPYRDVVAFGAIGESIGGIRHLTGYPPGVTDLPPVRTGIALADNLAAVYTVGGILSAVYERDVAGTGRGRCVDMALYEGIFSFLEGCLPEYGYAGKVRAPEGAIMPTAAPSNTYATADGQWLIIAGNSDLIFGRLSALIGRPELPQGPKFDTNEHRVENRDELDGIIAGWVKQRSSAEASALLDAAHVPASRIYDIEDCANDPHFRARGMIREVPDKTFGTVLHPGVVPRFADDGAQGNIAWGGPAIGAHNEEIYGGLLGLAEDELQRLQQEGII